HDASSTNSGDRVRPIDMVDVLSHWRALAKFVKDVTFVVWHFKRVKVLLMVFTTGGVPIISVPCSVAVFRGDHVFKTVSNLPEILRITRVSATAAIDVANGQEHHGLVLFLRGLRCNDPVDLSVYASFICVVFNSTMQGGNVGLEFSVAVATSQHRAHQISAGFHVISVF